VVSGQTISVYIAFIRTTRMDDKNDLLKQLNRIQNVFGYASMTGLSLGLLGPFFIVEHGGEAHTIIALCTIGIVLFGMVFTSFIKYQEVKNFLIEKVRPSEPAHAINAGWKKNEPSSPGFHLKDPSEYHIWYRFDDPKGACERAKKEAIEKLKEANVDIDRWLFWQPSPRMPSRMYDRVSKEEYDAYKPNQRKEITISPYNF
jgi:hypothetical protein